MSPAPWGTLLSSNEQFATLIAPDELEVAFRISTEQYARLVKDRGALPDMRVSAALDVSGIDLIAQGTVNPRKCSGGRRTNRTDALCAP